MFTMAPCIRRFLLLPSTCPSPMTPAALFVLYSYRKSDVLTFTINEYLVPGTPHDIYIKFPYFSIYY